MSPHARRASQHFSTLACAYQALADWLTSLRSRRADKRRRSRSVLTLADDFPGIMRSSLVAQRVQIRVGSAPAQPGHPPNPGISKSPWPGAARSPNPYTGVPNKKYRGAQQGSRSGGRPPPPLIRANKPKTHPLRPLGAPPGTYRGAQQKVPGCPTSVSLKLLQNGVFRIVFRSPFV